MKVSTRARYGVRLMFELALHFGKGPIMLKDIAREEEISEKYLSQIIIPLRGLGLVKSVRGARGGYTLSRLPSQIKVKEIVDILEGNGGLVDCIRNPLVCRRVPFCVSRDIWAMVGDKISEILASVTLGDMVKMHRKRIEKNIMYNI